MQRRGIRPGIRPDPAHPQQIDPAHPQQIAHSPCVIALLLHGDPDKAHLRNFSGLGGRPRPEPERTEPAIRHLRRPCRARARCSEPAILFLS